MDAHDRIPAKTKLPVFSGRDARTVSLLLALSGIPLVAGAWRLGQLVVSGTSGSLRAATDPVPLAVHAASCTLFLVLGAFQLAPDLRVRRPGLHSWSGRIALPAALVGALSGLWLSFFHELPDTDGPLLALARLVVSVLMTDFVVLGAFALGRRDFRAHGAWLVRAYALAEGAGTQSLLLLGWMALVGPLDAAIKGVLMTLAWVANGIVAELWLRRRNEREGTVPGHLAGI